MGQNKTYNFPIKINEFGAGGIVQLVEWLPSLLKAVGSIPPTLHSNQKWCMCLESQH